MTKVLNVVDYRKSYARNLQNGQFISASEAGKLVKKEIEKVFSRPATVSNSIIDTRLGVDKITHSAFEAASVFKAEGLAETEKALEKGAQSGFLSKAINFLKSKNGKFAMISAVSLAVLGSALYFLNKSDKVSPKPTKKYVSQDYVDFKIKKLKETADMFPTGQNKTKIK